jgi:hypothetical protein
MAEIIFSKLELVSFQPSSAIQSEYGLVSGQEFKGIITDLRSISPRYAENLSAKQDYDQLDCWISHDRMRGFAVGPDRELTNVFSFFSVGDQGQGIIKFAQDRYDHLHLNCFSGRLVDIYNRCGFEEVRREPNWGGAHKPDVVFMEWRL